MKRAAAALLAAFLPVSLRAALSGPPITDNDYRVDLSRGVAMGSTEQVGLGGAHAARAHGASDLADNPAAVAARPGYAGETWDWDGDLGSFTVGGRDFDNNGSESSVTRRTVVTRLGGLVRYKEWGLGLYGIAQQYQVETAGVVRRADFNTTHVVVGRSWKEGHMVWGLGLRIAEAKMQTADRSDTLLHLSGSGVTAGLQWDAPWRGVRMGAAYQSAVHDDPKRSLSGSGTVKVDGLFVPKGVDLPSTLSGGLSYTADRWLAAADLVVTGAVKGAYGIESFLEKKQQPSGLRATVSPRLGLQSETLPNRLRLRAGSYYEPSRFRGVHGRWHGTAGFEARLFTLRLFGEHPVSMSAALDGAPRYGAAFLSLGFWH